MENQKERRVNLQISKSGDQFMVVLVSSCCCNKLPQTQWLKAIQIYYVIVLRDRSPKRGYRAKIKVSAGLIPSGISRGECLLAFVSFQRLPVFLGSWPLFPSSKPSLQSHLHWLWFHHFLTLLIRTLVISFHPSV